MYKICQTEGSAKRQRELEAGLLAAMQKQPYNKITLSDLCRQLGVPRKTFYRYFPTKDDALLALVDHTLADCSETVLYRWDGTVRLEYSHLKSHFDYWYAHRDFLDVIQENDLYFLLLDRTTNMIDGVKAAGTPWAADFARESVEYFIAHGLMTTVLRWHVAGFPNTAEEMAEVYARLLANSDLSVTKFLM